MIDAVSAKQITNNAIERRWDEIEQGNLTLFREIEEAIRTAALRRVYTTSLTLVTNVENAEWIIEVLRYRYGYDADPDGQWKAGQVPRITISWVKG